MLAAALLRGGASEAAEAAARARRSTAQPDAARRARRARRGAPVAVALRGGRRGGALRRPRRRPGRRPPRGPRVFGALAAEAADEDVRRRPGLGPRRRGCPTARPARWRPGSPHAPAPRAEPASVPAGAAAFTLTDAGGAAAPRRPSSCSPSCCPSSTRSRSARATATSCSRACTCAAASSSRRATSGSRAMPGERPRRAPRSWASSQVAAARGLDEDAELLAGEARSLATA